MHVGTFGVRWYVWCVLVRLVCIGTSGMHRHVWCALVRLVCFGSSGVHCHVLLAHSLSQVTGSLNLEDTVSKQY